jgi:hypothetical protein
LAHDWAQVPYLEFTPPAVGWPPLRRILCQAVALLLTLEGKCLRWRAKPAHFGCHLPSVSGHFLPVFFATLALTSLLGSLASLIARGMYGGLQGFVFLMGLAILALTGWWWPGMLILLGIASILGALNIPGIAGLLGLGILSRNSQKPQEAYQPADPL